MPRPRTICVLVYRAQGHDARSAADSDSLCTRHSTKGGGQCNTMVITAEHKGYRYMKGILFNSLAFLCYLALPVSLYGVPWVGFPHLDSLVLTQSLRHHSHVPATYNAMYCLVAKIVHKLASTLPVHLLGITDPLANMSTSVIGRQRCNPISAQTESPTSSSPHPLSQPNTPSARPASIDSSFDPAACSSRYKRP